MIHITDPFGKNPHEPPEGHLVAAIDVSTERSLREQSPTDNGQSFDDVALPFTLVLIHILVLVLPLSSSYGLYNTR